MITEAAHVFVEIETRGGLETAVAAYEAGKLAGLARYHEEKTARRILVVGSHLVRAVVSLVEHRVSLAGHRGPGPRAPAGQRRSVRDVGAGDGNRRSAPEASRGPG